MSADRTVLEHLLDGRDALVLEVKRLTIAIDELDVVIGRIGGTAQVSGALPDRFATSTASGGGRAEPVTSGAPVNSPAGVETGRSSRSQRKTTTKTSTPRGRASANPPKSIRVHVLEMLEADNRDFGLAEIIERIRTAGIQAHDDAVRSITIKLMKDGKVERVGRGQYRLAGRGSASSAATSDAVASAPATGGVEVSAPSAAETTGPLSFPPPLNLAQPWESPQR